MNYEDQLEDPMHTLELNEPIAPFGKTFENLDAWKRACRLSVQIYSETAEWSDWGLRDQIRRSSISIPSNIAEGSERGSKADYVRFLRIAKGSTAELRTQLYIATKVSLLNSETSKEMVDETVHISRMLQGLINNLLNQAK